MFEQNISTVMQRFPTVRHHDLKSISAGGGRHSRGRRDGLQDCQGYQ